MKERPLIFIILAMVLVLIAGVLYPIWDFGGLYWYDAYNGIGTWEWLYFDHIVSGPLMCCSMFLLVSTFVLLLVSLISRKVGRKKAPYLIGIISVSVIFLISFIGMIAVAVVGETGDYDDWWWDGACFVGNIAPLLILPFLAISLIKVSRGNDIKE